MWGGGGGGEGGMLLYQVRLAFAIITRIVIAHLGGGGGGGGGKSPLKKLFMLVSACPCADENLRSPHLSTLMNSLLTGLQGRTWQGKVYVFVTGISTELVCFIVLYDIA